MGVNLDYSVSVVNVAELPTYMQNWRINTATFVSGGGASSNYAGQLQYMQSLKLNPVLDIEMDIWAGGQIQAPISNFTGFLQSVKAAGWPTVSSEGGRSGDAAFIKSLGLNYINYNCDQCGLWKDSYSDPATTMNLWECYYPWEVPYITQGSNATPGKDNGVLAGAWNNTMPSMRQEHFYPEHYKTAPAKNFKGDNDILSNSLSGATPSYESIIDGMIAAGRSVKRFEVWGGLASSVAQFQACGFNSIVANLQKNHPPNGTVGPAPVQKVTFISDAKTVSMSPGRIDGFAVGSDGKLWHAVKTGSVWGKWDNSLGGICTSAPDATARGINMIDVVVRGSDSHCYLREWNGSIWLDWQDLGGLVEKGNFGPKISSQSPTSLDLFCIGTDNGLWTKSMTNSAWSAWGEVSLNVQG